MFPVHAIEADLQFGRRFAVRIEQLEGELARALGGRGFHPKDHGEGVRLAAAPAVRRTGLSVKPVPLGIRPSHDVEGVALEAVIMARRGGKLAIAAVRLADLPQSHAGIDRTEPGPQGEGTQ